ncbi:MAG: DUF4384 domain-containing protein [Pseudomonadota bacterium]|nr:DUF4384 domain-containing protein [Pseudomonadota bacterium]
MGPGPRTLCVLAALALAGCVDAHATPQTKGLTRMSRAGEAPADVPVSPIVAVIVGVSDFAALPAAGDLPTGVADATLFADTLERSFQTTPRRLIGKDATHAAILREVQGALANARPEDTVLLYFATQGAMIGRQGYLLAADSDAGGSLAQTSLPLDVLAQAIRTSRAGQVIVLADAVHQPLPTGPGIGSGLAHSVAPLLGSLAQRAGVFVQPMEAGPAPRSGHGLYTQALVQALSGAGDLDRDGIVNLDEVAVSLQSVIPAVAPGVAGPSTYGTFHAPLGVPVGAVAPPPVSMAPPATWQAANVQQVTVCLARDGVTVPGDHVFHNGDELGLSVLVPAAGYLHIVGVGDDGSNALLYPWAGEDNRVARGATIQVPPASSDFPIYLDDPVGPEPVYVIYSATPLPSAAEVLAFATERAAGRAPEAAWTSMTGTKGLQRLRKVALATDGPTAPQLPARPCADYTPEGDDRAWVLEMSVRHE